MKRLTHVHKIISNERVKKHLSHIALLAVIILFSLLMFSILQTSLFGEIDPEKHIYFEIVFLLVIAVVAELIVSFLGIESVIIMMLLGILISPSSVDLVWQALLSSGLPLKTAAPHIFQHEELITIFAQLGGIILLFKVGLHSKVERIFAKENLLVALAGIIVPFAVGYGYSAATGNPFIYSLFVGAALTATSVGVTVAILKKRNLISERFSEVIIGAAVIDDILALLVLAGVLNIAETGSASLESVLPSFGLAVLFMIGTIVLGKYFTKFVDREGVSDRMVLMSLAFLIFMAYVAEVINLSAIVGAFLAGIVLSTSKHYKELEEKTYGLEMLFTPVFFISLGLLVDIRSLFTMIIPIIIITVLAIISKIVSCGGVAYFLKLKPVDSLIVGVGMVPRGEVALIIASIGLARGILSAGQFSVLSAMAILTAIIVPTLLTFLLSKRRSLG
jgi:Kef-type K+ transport system membrane component KefB